MTVLGGSWSATAGDFVQMILVVIITVIMGVLTLFKVGGLGAFFATIPERHLDWTQFDRPQVIVVFLITLSINQLIQMNSLLEGAARFIFVKDAHSAKKAIWIQTAGMALLPLIWIVPPMMAAVWHPDIASEFPKLNNPSEAAYVAMALDLLPTGLLGLLVCGIFAATVTSLNSQLNIVGGNFVRNIYIQVIRPGASEKEQITVGRLFMLIYGVIWIALGLGFQQVKGLELFDLLLLIAAATGLPLAAPLFLGIFFKKTPPWAGWSTMVAGFVPAAILSLLFKVDPFVQWLWRDPTMTTDEVIGRLWGAADLNAREIGDLKIAITTGVVAAVCVGWFFFTMLFYRKDEKPYVQQVDAFFKEMATPIQPEEYELGEHDNESRQTGVLGNLCLIYGGFVLLLVLIPNEASGRLIILCCGLLMTGIGLALKFLSKRYRLKAGAMASGCLILLVSLDTARAADAAPSAEHPGNRSWGTTTASQPAVDRNGFVVLDSLEQLRHYISKDGMKIRLKPGVYRLDTASSRHFLQFSGNDSHWDLNGVIISASLDLFRQFRRGQGFYCVIDVTGDRNILEGLTVTTHGEGYGRTGRNKLFNITGSDCLITNVTAITRGSHPWGYGSLFGIAGGIVRKMNGIRIGQPARNTRLIGCRVHMRAMGHGIFIQGARDTLIQDCHVDGLLRLTDDILAETNGIAFERGFKVPGYGEGVQIGPDRRIPPNEIVSLSEDGIRMYPDSDGIRTGRTIIRNCTVTNMRRGICTGLSRAPDQIIHCEVRNCIAAGFNISSGDVVVGCRADAKYAEALCIPYMSAEGTRAEVEILDSREHLANNLVAKINGRHHTVTLCTADPAFLPADMSIELATTNGYGSFQRGRRTASGVTLTNHTPARVILFPGASHNRIVSRGPVADRGHDNNIVHLAD